MDSFYSREELNKLGLKAFGEDVKISRNCKIYNASKIEVGNHVRIDDFTILSGKIKLHNYIHISAYTALYGKGGIEIFDFCGCSPRTTIFSATDDFSGNHMVSPMVPEEMTSVECKKVILNKYVQLGANTIVMPGVVIKEGTATATFTFVNVSLSEWTVFGGIPCHKIKDRDKKIKKLAKDIWWE